MPDQTQTPATEPNAQAAVAAAVDAPAKPAAKPSALERTAAAVAEVEAEAARGKDTKAAGESTGSTSTSGTDPKAAGDKPAGGKTEPEPDKKASRGLAEIAEREAALVETQRNLKAQTAAIEARAKDLDTRTAAFTKAQKLVETGDHLGALAAIGIDLEKAQDQYLASLREPSPEDIGRKAARDEWQRIEDERKTKDKETQDAALKEHETKLGQVRDRYMADTVQAIKDHKDEFDFLLRHKKPNGEEIDTQDILDRAIKIERATGKTPDPIDVMRAIERELDEAATGTRKFGSAAKPAGDKQAEATRDTASRTLTNRDAGDVPLVKKPAGRKSTAMERLEEAKREHGVS